MFKISKLSKKAIKISPDEIMQRIDVIVKKNELEQLKERIAFLRSDLPRLEASYMRLMQLIKEAEEDYEWMNKRIAELERENERLRELYKKREIQ